ncbi:hypothetical protein PMIN01_01715 [Paraphaeosphaeria minitans]|uniref:Uncharacterized protein n=1 Tax=Paraphaeosphaeria minitans TaxID=565426 RepID=A0A9P6GPL5_9PLEO|nr:hypothetical protein PMIN01_01715 [Paraphaeosphaeria minitans]
MQRRESDLARRSTSDTYTGRLLPYPTPGAAAQTGRPADLQTSIVPARALPSLYLPVLAPRFPRPRLSQCRRGLVCAPFAAPDSNSFRVGQSACRPSRASARLHTFYGPHRQVHAANCCIARCKSRYA